MAAVVADAEQGQLLSPRGAAAAAAAAAAADRSVLCAVRTMRGNVFSMRMCPAGSVLLGPHWPMLICTFALILVPSSLLWTFNLITRGFEIQIFAFALQAATVGSLAWTAFSDPGIVTP